MKQEWQITKIGEQIKLQRGHDITKKEQRRGNIPVVSSSGVNSYHDTAKAKGPGVVIGRKGSLGTVYYLPEDYWPHDTTLYVVDFKDNYPLFVYYFLLSMSKRFYSMDNATANPALNRNHVHPIQVLWPPIHEQKAIASILGALDDKIELNNKMNETLETMARALYKSWFVDFDPVVAKAAGKRPFGMYDETAALFPDKFVDSELGPIPEGWQVEYIGEIVERKTVGKKYNQKTVFSEGDIPVLDQGRSGIIGYHNSEPGVIADPNNPIAIFANHTCYMRLVMHPFSTIQNVIPFVGKGTDTVWAYHATLDQQEFVEYKGHWPDFIVNKITTCPETLSRKFRDAVLSWHQMQFENSVESQTLSHIRDILLPKLISGEIRIKDAEKVVEEVL